MSEREPIATIPYETVKFKFIFNHWDVHLKGTCIYNGELCEFENDGPIDDAGEWLDRMMVRIYRIDFLTKLKWVKMQWEFERNVGTFWSYINGKRGEIYIKRGK